jgi:hypothetical protein
MIGTILAAVCMLLLPALIVLEILRWRRRQVDLADIQTLLSERESLLRSLSVEDSRGDEVVRPIKVSSFWHQWETESLRKTNQWAKVMQHYTALSAFAHHELTSHFQLQAWTSGVDFMDKDEDEEWLDFAPGTRIARRLHEGRKPNEALNQ